MLYNVSLAGVDLCQFFFIKNFKWDVYKIGGVKREHKQEFWGVEKDYIILKKVDDLMINPGLSFLTLVPWSLAAWFLPFIY